MTKQQQITFIEKILFPDQFEEIDQIEIETAITFAQELQQISPDICIHNIFCFTLDHVLKIFNKMLIKA